MGRPSRLPDGDVMTTIAVPARIEAIDELEATAAASSVTTAFRGSAAGVSDVSSWARAHGAPAGWTGDAADAATHAMTGFAVRTDVVVAALEKAARACDTYVDQVVALTKDRGDLVSDRGELNAAIDALVAEINASTEADVEALRSRSERLQARATMLTDRIAAFWERVTTAEDRLISALRSVDTTAEARREADRPGRPDTDALRRDLEALGDHPAAVTRWWRALTDAERCALKISDPGLVGNTNGIPTGDRDEANRTSLERDLSHLESLGDERSSDQDRQLQHMRETVVALGLPGDEIDPETGLPVDVNLIVYEPTAFEGDGAVAVAYGDPDVADNTAVIVPGLTNDASSIAGQGRDAFQLFQESSGDGESAAVIAWMGYDAPNLSPDELLDYPGEIGDVAGVTGEAKAEAGGHRLSTFVDGLRATDEGDRSHLTVIGHSYGSTTAAHAAADGLSADALTLIGSPGAGGDDVNDVRDLHMPEGKVYVGSADNDFVTWLGRDGDLGMGQDPAQADFGATRFEVDDGPEFHADNLGQGVANHNSYFDPVANPQSLDNLATIVRGDEPTLVPGRSQDANDMATDWVKDEIRYQVDRELETTWHEVQDTYHAGTHWVGDRIDDFQGLWP